MPEVLIPNPEKSRALLVIDLQEGFIKDKVSWIIPTIREALMNGGYSIVVETNFHNTGGVAGNKELKWNFSLQPTIHEIKKLLPETSILVTKNTKSAFKGDQDLVRILRVHNIEEIHIVGLDTEDCVFATAQDAHDYGFSSYVLEECTESTENFDYRASALKILRHLKMTNHSAVTASKKIIGASGS